ncbi:threonine--tRNA ligase [Candidatus Daviesbacteria bacterium]|nr:threonine--tRNA ligase [Candidatus Daviesbacteria bacterium]
MKQTDIDHLRHSCAHLLAAAVLELFPKAKNAIGPAIENGFYQDFDFGDTKISEDDLPEIEGKMHQLLKNWDTFEINEVPVNQAKKDFAKNPYKLELVNEFAKEGIKITETQQGKFLDLCKGGHVGSPKEEVKHFKLLSVAGAYWRGNEKNKMLTRIYGTCFPSQKELDQYLENLEQAKLRDHRRLGKELDLFVFSDLVGSGLPMFTPRGTILRNELLNFSEQLQLESGYEKVFIPHITKTELYKKSGHWDKFGSELFLVKSQETDEQFVLKPMNCPHHTQIYASRKRSYKELPIRYMETTVQYRDEKPGELLGLSRVRAITIDDSHVFCTPEQIEGEFSIIINMLRKLYSSLNMTFRARLSFRDDSNKFLGDKKHWEDAQKTLEKVAKNQNLDYVIVEGEAAFYGPKIDILVMDSLGRQWQCATEQLDFVQPARFGLTYTDADGIEKTPFMVHKALLGSIERFLSVYIEHTAGNFPLWLAPTQVSIIPISEKHNSYAQKVEKQLKANQVRALVDLRNEKMQSKIRDAQRYKVPLMIILGDKEVQSETVTVRTRSGENKFNLKFEKFLKDLTQKITTKA